MRLCLLNFVFMLLGLTINAQEPASNPTTIQFSNPKSYGFSVSFNQVTADGYLVVKSEQPITFVPVDGVVYQKGEGVGNGAKIISTNTNFFLNVREVIENTTYNIRVFAYNGSGASINYKQTLPLDGSFTSPASTPGSYYSGIDSSSFNFLNSLTTLLKAHTQVSYTAYKSLILPVIYERDTINNSMVVNCEYSNTTTVYNPPFDFVAQQYNREHSLPKSWMLTGGNTANLDGSDYHNLLLTQAAPNQARSNNPQGIVLNTTSTFGEAKLGTDAFGNTVFEPKNNRKGDVARAMFYQMVTYNGDGGNWGFDNLLTFANLQDQNVLKLWHQQDPPDKFERTKTDYIYSIQNNRNPFIDFPGWVNCINFDSLVKTNFCGAVSSINDDDANLNFNLNVTSGDELLLQWPSGYTGELNVTVCDITGNIVLMDRLSVPKEQSQISLQMPSLPNGIYIVAFAKDGLGMSAKKFVR